MKRKLTKTYCLLGFLMLFAVKSIFAQYNKTVSKDGTGDYLTVQAAIDAAPTGLTAPYRIFIKNGTYKEVVNVPSNKPFIQLVGESVANTIITFDNYSGKAMPGGGTYGTSTSATVTVNATDFSAVNITFENTTGESPQALAINVNNDRASFKNCRFLGGQDTLLANNNGLRQYYLNCYIDGTVDFIFGNARAVFDYCVIYPKDRSVNGGSYITAANTKSPEPYGFVFRNCEITASTGNTLYVLGRPWQNDTNTADASKSRNQTVFINTKMGASVNPVGWAIWDAGTNTSYINYAEYNSQNPDGTPLNVSSRISWSKQLNATEAAEYSNANLFAGWDPTAMFLDAGTYTQPLVVSNFRGTKGVATTPFKWNISWPITGVQYDVYRSTDNGQNFLVVNTQTSSTANVNFNYTDNNPPPGQSYLYYVKASKSGYADYISDIVTISSVPTITISGNLGAFLQGLGTPSNPQSYAVSAVDLSSDLIITPPVGYEISINGGTNWYDLNNPIHLTPSSGAVANTTVSVRLNATSAAGYDGNITHTSTGAFTVNQAVSGTVQTAPLVTSSSIITWPLTVNNTAVITTGLVATTPTFNNFVISDGSGAIAPYSVANGEAFAVGATGGNWQTSATPPGPGSLNRNYYKEFTVQPSTNYQLKIDSIIFNTSVANTTGHFAVSYSTDDFVTTTDINTGIDPTGASIAFGLNGAFPTTAITLIQENSTNVSKYKFPLSNLIVPTGKVLKIRIYYRTGSSSTGRYAKIKDFTVKGEATATLPLKLVSFRAVLNTRISPEVNLTWKTNSEENTAKFDIERSIDGNEFVSLGSVKAKNIAGEHTYNFTDYNPLAGTAYYRLKLADIDGKFTYSDLQVINNKTAINFSVYPNPVSNLLSVSHASNKSGNAYLKIISLDGRVVKTIAIAAETTLTNVAVADLKSGVYFIQYNGEENFVLRFIKQ